MQIEDLLVICKRSTRYRWLSDLQCLIRCCNDRIDACCHIMENTSTLVHEGVLPLSSRAVLDVTRECESRDRMKAR
jgi:hypothetical protein